MTRPSLETEENSRGVCLVSSRPHFFNRSRAARSVKFRQKCGGLEEGLV